MVMNLLVVAVVLGLGYIWMSRGFFSSFLNLVCVIAAGAIALGFWESTAHMLLNSAPKAGILSFVYDAAWGISLGGLFAVSLAVLRVVVDQVIKANAVAGTVGDIVGGALCGVASGIIVAGILAISAGFFRLAPDMGFLGYQSVGFAPGGSPQRKDGLWLPADALTASFYGRLSGGVFSSSTPLKDWYPNLRDVPGTMRMSYGEGQGRIVYAPDSVQILSRYSVEVPAGGKPDALLTDSIDTRVQQVTDFEGKPPAAGSRIEGFVLAFAPSAKEKSGQVIMSNGQARLLLRDPATGETATVFPFATLAKAESDKVAFARFRFDSGGQGVHIPSVGADSEARFALEFLAPPKFEPVALYVRNNRYPIPAGEKPKQVFASAAQRDGAIQGLMGGASAGPLDESLAVTVSTSGVAPDGVSVSNSVGNLVIVSGSQGPSMEVTEVRGGNAIRNGTASFRPSEFSNNRGLERQLRVDRFEVREGTIMVQVDVSQGRQASLLSDAASRVAPDASAPALIDTNGSRYDAVGYIYEDEQAVNFRYTVDKPMRTLSELPEQLSRSKPSQKLRLLFLCSSGVTIDRLALGNMVLAKYRPPFQMPAKQE